MTALAVAKEVIAKEGKVVSFPIAASTTIFKGAHVMIDAGYLKPSATGAASYGAGMALEDIDNSAGSDGDLWAKVDIVETVKLDGFTGLAITDVGKTAYASDDQTFSVTQGNDIPVGKIIGYVSATTFWVKPEFGGVSV